VKRRYEEWKPGPDAMAVVEQANGIVTTYQAQGYDLTLRQLYYQFVARDLIPNNQRSYKRLGSIVNKARLAGLMDWSAIVDRTRNLEHLSHWDDPADIVYAVARQFQTDLWADQPTRVEVWVEKEALAGVVERAAKAHDVSWFSCRGYVSQSELWGAARRHLQYVKGGQRVLVLHLGDHDPSGIDMTRDITDRLDDFLTMDWLYEMDSRNHATSYQLREAMVEHLDLTGPSADDHARHGQPPYEVRRIALNMDQVEEYDPPPNPAKLTDSRSSGYCERFGDDSWELDALEPAVLADLITEHIEGALDVARYNDAVDARDQGREELAGISRHYEEMVEHLDVLDD
jgi:hypothetical protein